MDGVILAAVHVGKAQLVADLVRQVHVILAALAEPDGIGRFSPIDLQIPQRIGQVARCAVVRPTDGNPDLAEIDRRRIVALPAVARSDAHGILVRRLCDDVDNAAKRLRAVEHGAAALHDLDALHGVETHHVEVADVVKGRGHAVDKDKCPILHAAQIHARIARDPRLSIRAHVREMNAVLEFQRGDHVACARLLQLVGCVDRRVCGRHERLFLIALRRHVDRGRLVVLRLLCRRQCGKCAKRARHACHPLFRSHRILLEIKYIVPLYRPSATLR